MKLDDAKAIIALMTENGLSEFEMEEDGLRISIKKETPASAQNVLPAQAPAPSIAAEPRETAERDAAGNFEEVKAPFVGTFYRASAPDADPYVTVGTEVEADSVLCVIEAMKVMNEIKSEVRGIVRAILAENAHPVQYGQPLFRIEKI